MKRLIILITVFLAGSVQAGSNGFPSLKMGTDARSGALGMAYTAMANDGSGGYWNPAGLAGINGSDLILSVQKWIEGVRSEFFGLAWGGEKHGIGIHLLYTQVDDIEYRVGPSPQPLSTFSSHELVAGISYARTVYRKLSFGITVKGLYEKIFINEALGVAIDAGFLLEVYKKGLRIGGVIQNIGYTSPMQQESIQLPFLGKLGLALPLRFVGCRWLFIADCVKERGYPFHLHAGMEFGWRQIVFLRFGFQNGYETRGFSCGAGVVWGKYRLEHNYMPLGHGLGDSHRITIGICWM